MYIKSFEQLKQNSIGFVLKREKENGGFASTPLLPATIEDTYFATEILKLLEFQIDKEKHKSFLFKHNLNLLNVDLIAKLLKILNNLSLLEEINPKDLNSLMRKLKNKSKKKSISLKELSDLAEIFAIFKEEKELLYLKNRVLRNLSKIRLKLIKDFYFLCKIVQRDFPKKFLENILNAQNPDGGFGFFKGTTSYMENTYYACYILYTQGLKPKDLNKLKNFVLSCWNKDGGFGRNSQGVSFLESTYHALWILKRILD